MNSKYRFDWLYSVANGSIYLALTAALVWWVWRWNHLLWMVLLLLFPVSWFCGYLMERVITLFSNRVIERLIQVLGKRFPSRT